MIGKNYLIDSEYKYDNKLFAQFNKGLVSETQLNNTNNPT